MNETARVMFLEARDTHRQAMAQAARMQVYKAAVLAWSASWRATDALILARTGRLPQKVGETCDGVRSIVCQDPQAYGFSIDFFHRCSDLYDSAIASRSIFPPSHFIEVVSDTGRFIDMAEHLSGIDGYPD